jgi:beta-mannosidase
MPRTMGTIYWQLNDMWPAPSWSSLDWKGNWKALHHIARRFYAPLMISGLEDLTKKTVEIHVTSDKHTEQTATVVYVITDAAGHPLEQGTHEVTIAPHSNQCVHTLDLAPHLAARGNRDVVVWLALRVEGQIISENLVLLCRPKHLALKDPNILVNITPLSDNQVTVTLTAEAAALYVWLELAGARTSDNFVHLLPNQPHTITVTLPDGVDASALQVHSLVDTYK